MKLEDYKSQVEMFKREYDKGLSQLRARYAAWHGKASKGMYVCDGAEQIVVDKITMFIAIGGVPTLQYTGVMVTKLGNLYKTGERGGVTQSKTMKYSKEFIR